MSQSFWLNLPRNLVEGFITDAIKYAIFALMVSRLWVFFNRTVPSRLRWKTSLDWRTIRKPKQSPIVILGVIASGKSHYKNVLTDMGQVRATAALAPSLNNAHRAGLAKSSVIFSSSNLLASLKTRDLISLGGAKNNAVSEEILFDINAKLGKRYGLKNIPSVKYPGQTVDVPVWNGRKMFSDENDRIAYGMIIRTYNHAYPDQTMTILAGAGTHGTEAAAIALSNDKELVRMIRKAKNSEEFLVLVKATTQPTSDGGEEIISTEIAAFSTFADLSAN